MSIEQTDRVDVISVDGKTGDLILTISDHLEWTDTISHQKILQAKINKYLSFVESGEILQMYPDAKGRKIIFDVVLKFSPDPEGARFLARAREVVQRAGFDLRAELFAQSYDN